MPKCLPPSDKYRKKSNVFYRYTCRLWVRTAAILSCISGSHYDFLHNPKRNNLFSAPIALHRFGTVYFSSTLKTRRQFFISISESMVKALRICQSSGYQTFSRSYLRLRVHSKLRKCYSFRGSALHPAGVAYYSPPKTLASFTKQNPAENKANEVFEILLWQHYYCMHCYVITDPRL